MNKIMKQFDIDGNGYITFEEACEALIPNNGESLESRLSFTRIFVN